MGVIVNDRGEEQELAKGLKGGRITLGKEEAEVVDENDFLMSQMGFVLLGLFSFCSWSCQDLTR